MMLNDDDNDWNAELLFFDEELPKMALFVATLVAATIAFGLLVLL